jgi:hypothetical protein
VIQGGGDSLAPETASDGSLYAAHNWHSPRSNCMCVAA